MEAGEATSGGWCEFGGVGSGTGCCETPFGCAVGAGPSAGNWASAVIVGAGGRGNQEDRGTAGSSPLRESSGGLVGSDVGEISAMPSTSKSVAAVDGTGSPTTPKPSPGSQAGWGAGLNAWEDAGESGKETGCRKNAKPPAATFTVSESLAAGGPAGMVGGGSTCAGAKGPGNSVDGGSNCRPSSSGSAGESKKSHGGGGG